MGTLPDVFRLRNALVENGRKEENKEKTPKVLLNPFTNCLSIPFDSNFNLFVPDKNLAIHPPLMDVAFPI